MGTCGCLSSKHPETSPANTTDDKEVEYEEVSRMLIKSALFRRKIILALALFVLLFGVFPVHAEVNGITEEEILHAQKGWAEGVVSIGRAYVDKKDYEAAAAEFVDAFYGYDKGPVLFKPTKASAVKFRSTKEEALSYFVKGSIPEDHGFVLQPWSNVRFKNAGIVIDSDSALAMGVYFFTDATTSEEVEVEYTFGYFKDESGKIRIMLHHSSLPYAE